MVAVWAAAQHLRSADQSLLALLGPNWHKILNKYKLIAMAV